DLLDASATTGDSNEFEDLQFYMTYMNKSGIEVAFSALEKMEHNLALVDLFDSSVGDILKALPGDDIKTALETTIFHVNATAPFQQLVQHYITPWEEDVFVTNNFMCLVAYSSSPDNRTMDADDVLYIGYTFSVQELIDAVNDVLDDNGHSEDQIGHFNYEASFEPTATGYKFGIEYSNMFVLWQDAKVPLTGIDIFNAGEQFIKGATGGIAFGHGIVAASLLDSVGFEYEFTTTNMTDHIKGTVTTHYNIGETNFLVTKDDQDYVDAHTDNWTNSPFVEAPSYTFNIPDGLKTTTVTNALTALGLSIPNSVTVNLNDLAFYFGDDAKKRMMMKDGFGLSVVTSTATFGNSVVDPELTVSDNIFTLSMGENAYFETDFVGKDTYKLLGLETLFDIDPAEDRPVIIVPFFDTNYAINSVAKAYFAVEFEMAYGFTRFVATELSTEYFDMPAGTAQVYVEAIEYFTFTQFPEWYGGEIIHDPAYSAVAAMAATSSETSDTGPPDTTAGIPGFELLSVLLAIPPLYALYRKRRS
ncbi:MAG: Heimdall-CTERM domain-containing surface protein, partial [Candidatus Hodarchaeales archaeon]